VNGVVRQQEKSGMDLQRFSPAAFEELAGDPHAVRQLANELQDAVLAEIGTAASERFKNLVAVLNGLGHRLTPYEDRSDGHHVRDYTNPNQCALRLAVDARSQPVIKT
jgi:hypothetical protein